MKRVFLIVLDSFGIGQMPDAAAFGDMDVNTLASCAATGMLEIPNMVAAGLGNIDGVDCLPKTTAPTGAVARLTEKSMGKDTTIGHWEITGFHMLLAICFNDRSTGPGGICQHPSAGGFPERL